MVLDDYLRLKKLFAARLVTVSTSQGDHSSVTEVGSGGKKTNDLSAPAAVLFLSDTAGE